ncbi:MAG: hypothetical protein R2774_10190 [Saprospiraceae bacterium]
MSISKKFIPSKKTYSVTFSYPVASNLEAKEVKVLGDFNNWDPALAPKMKKTKSDFSVSIELTEGRYEFRYFIDNKSWDNDFAADGYVRSPFIGIENSVLFVEPAPLKPSKTPTAKKEVKIATEKAAPKAKVVKVKTEKPAPIAKVAKVTAPKVKVEKAVTSPKVSKAVATKADDLTKIEGIGPKIAGLLTDNGVATFVALSTSKPETLKSILDKGGSRMQMHDPTTWPAQAKLAANGSWDELKKLQDELKGGRKA